MSYTSNWKNEQANHFFSDLYIKDSIIVCIYMKHVEN